MFEILDRISTLRDPDLKSCQAKPSHIIRGTRLNIGSTSGTAAETVNLLIPFCNES